MSSLPSTTPSAQAGPSKPPRRSAKPETPARPQKIAKNKRLPATMVTSQGTIAPSKKTNAKDKQKSSKQKQRSEKGIEKAVELAKRLEEKVKGREERKVCTLYETGEGWRSGADVLRLSGIGLRMLGSELYTMIMSGKRAREAGYDVSDRIGVNVYNE